MGCSRQLSGYLNTLRQPDFFKIADDVIGGTSSNDVINGGLGNDKINGGSGDDVISGGSGNDNLDGGFGNDKVSGNDGNDTIRDGLGVDTLDGGNGNDTLNLDLSGQTVNLTISNPSNGINLPGIVTATNFENFIITTGSGNDQILQPALIGGVVYRSNDTFNGGAGNDTINPGLGLNDQVNGATGDDLLILDYSVDDVGKGMSFTAYTGAEGSSGSAGRTSTTGAWIDSISFSGINRFQITGTSKNDSITTSAGDDTVDGGAGDDTINVSAGNDIVDGGAGKDRLIVDLSAQTTNVTLTFSLGSNVVIGGVTATNIENFSLKTGMGDDSITQLTSANSVIYRSDDNFNTGAGNDSINAGLGDDTVEGGVGDDLLILDYSIDDVGKEMRFNTYNSNGEFYGSAYRQFAANSNYLDYIEFKGINRFQVTGTSKNDIITTGAGNDTVSGGAGNDTINVGTGNDVADGGTGKDRLIVNLSAQTSNLNLSLTDNVSLTGVTATNFESFSVTTGSGNDSITQLTSVNGVISRGDDNFQTGAGNDSINAGLGDDTVAGGVGDDLLILDYSVDDVGKEVRFNSYNSSGEFYGSAYRQFAANSNYLDYIEFSGINRFQVTGTSKNDIITTGAGNDTVNGGAGNDTINVGTGNDVADGGTGKDRLIVNLSAQTSNLNLSLTDNVSLTGVTATNFESFSVTTGSGNDSINQPTTLNGAVFRGDDNFNTGAGNDSINAGLGDDTVAGGVGDDLLILDYSVDDVGKEVRFNSYNSSGEFYGSAYRQFAANSNYLDYIEFSGINRFQVTGTSKNDIITTGAGNDTVNGGAGNDTINVGTGNDILIAGLGNDTLTGGIGADEFTFNAANQGIDIITDFVSLQGDKIFVSASGFGGGLIAGATITAEQFVLGTAAADASDRFIYNLTNGNLLFDIDGIGSQAAINIATFSSNPLISDTDIIVLA